MSWPTEGLSTNDELIVIPWNESVESYVALGADVEYELPAKCPDCDHLHLVFWGKRKRFAAHEKQSFVLFVRRVRCKGCGRTHTILPAFLLRNQAYLTELILLVLVLFFTEHKSAKSISAELDLARSTVRRWVFRFRASAAIHYRQFLFLRHNLLPQSPSPPATGYPRAALTLLSELFGLKLDDSGGFGRWVSLATGGRLLFYQPAMAP